MKLRRKIQITGYIESDTEDMPSMLAAASATMRLTSPKRDIYTEVDELPETFDLLLAADYRSLADLDVKIGPAKRARAARA